MAIEIILVHRGLFGIFACGYLGKNYDRLSRVYTNWRAIKQVLLCIRSIWSNETDIRIALAAFARLETVAICGSEEYINNTNNQGP